jgi:hypothetical protein
VLLDRRVGDGTVFTGVGNCRPLPPTSTVRVSRCAVLLRPRGAAMGGQRAPAPCDAGSGHHSGGAGRIGCLGKIDPNYSSSVPNLAKLWPNFLFLDRLNNVSCAHGPSPWTTWMAGPSRGLPSPVELAGLSRGSGPKAKARDSLVG